MYDDDKVRTGQDGLTDEFDLSSKPTMTVDVERYQKYLEESDMSAAEKEEFLQSLWQIIVSFVELGYGVHPLQEVCGKDAGTASGSAKEAMNAVSSRGTEQEEKPKRPIP
ncbi:hypothetical protein [Ruegeria sp. HKCCC1038]|uniref:hypothetical protein n=1 Tax=Ruegeria sp. HKCCC1038 TaxID=2682982 RepID=UPI001487A40D|nr:hypothetical protein [Ruegeria sp. HKCCC1038]